MPRFCATHGAADCRPWAETDTHRLRGVSNYEQFRPLFEKLRRGEPITVLLFGSSIAGSLGGCYHNSAEHVLQHVESMPPTYGDVKERLGCSNDGVRFGFAGALMEAINATWPHPEHILINQGWPGATLKVFTESDCVNHHTPASVDLLLMEQYLDVDLKRNTSERQGGEVERLWYQVTRRGGKQPPPTVLLHFFTWLRPSDEMSLSGCIWDLGDTCSSTPVANNCTEINWTEPDQYHQLEEMLDATAQFYGWSTLSLRNFVWSAVRDGMHTAHNQSFCEFLGRVFTDRIHPSVMGTMLYGDALIDLLARANQHVDTYPTPAPAALPVPPPRPFASGAWKASADRTCLELEKLHVERSTDWAFHSSELVNGRIVHKPGWISSSAHAEIVFKLDALDASRTNGIHVNFLRSYSTDMGIADAFCEGGCSCESVRLSGTYGTEAYQHASMVETANIHLSGKKPDGSPAICLLRFAVIESAAPGFKMKVVGISFE